MIIKRYKQLSSDGDRWSKAHSPTHQLNKLFISCSPNSPLSPKSPESPNSLDSPVPPDELKCRICTVFYVLAFSDHFKHGWMDGWMCTSVHRSDPSRAKGETGVEWHMTRRNCLKAMNCWELREWQRNVHYSVEEVVLQSIMELGKVLQSSNFWQSDSRSKSV